MTTTHPRALETVRTAGDLVAVIGASASGKTTLLTAAGIPSHRIVSLDRLRAAVSEPGDQSATPDAVLLQHHILTMRLRRGLTTYVDNTSVEAAHRLQLVGLAHQHGCRAVAIHLDLPLPDCLARNARCAAEARVPEDVLRYQHRMARDARDLLPREGWDEIRHHRTGH
ncbi:AAA family ATPase [Kitasatospora sp. NPDC015120]|uniref:AAA family ATPase n=1 Tax=Kitasatospora sp. NPDC015120 TaxID=3364023 RepID=UPI0036F4614F